MKQIILIGLLTGLLTASIPLRAQTALRDSDTRKGSRLELGRTPSTQKATVPVISSKRFSIVPKPVTTAPDRSVTLRKNAPINEYYRALLVDRSAAKPPVRPASGDATPVATSDIRPTPSLEDRIEDRLFANERLWVSNAYPNPADEFVELDYQFSGMNGEASLGLLNILGAPVAEHKLDRSDRKIRIATRDLPTGYYLYRLSVDGKKVATKRLLVRHQ